MAVVFQVENLSFAYGQTPILEDLNLEIGQGAILGIIGPNGAGKSTLLKLLAKTLEPQGGVIYYQGEPLEELARRTLARSLAVLGQQRPEALDLTAGEVVLLGRAPHLGPFAKEGPDDYEIVERSMGLTGTWDFAPRPFAQLSGGEQQRVMLARALAQEPQVLLLDEPTTHLDLNYQLELLTLVRELTLSRKLTAIMVLHDLNLAASFCEQLVLLSGGNILAAGAAEDVLREDLIAAAYGIKVQIGLNPLTARPQIAPLPRPLKKRQQRIHLIGGGGSIARLYYPLLEAGYTVSAGVLNRGDTDWQVAKNLGIELVEIPAFSPINKVAKAQNRALIEKAAAVVVGAFPFGPGNLENLKVLEGMTIPLFLISGLPVGKRDYTEGSGSSYYEKLEGKGKIVKPEKLLDSLQRIE